MKILMLTVTILLAGIAGSGYTQPTPPQNPQHNPDAVPIEGIEYLILTGVIYGIYRRRLKLQATSHKLQVLSFKPQGPSKLKPTPACPPSKFNS
jgi:hypothetical protein